MIEGDRETIPMMRERAPMIKSLKVSNQGNVLSLFSNLMYEHSFHRYIYEGEVRNKVA